jgi:hypothetical protein
MTPGNHFERRRRWWQSHCAGGENCRRKLEIQCRTERTSCSLTRKRTQANAELTISKTVISTPYRCSQTAEQDLSTMHGRAEAPMRACGPATESPRPRFPNPARRSMARGPGDKSSSLALENWAMREYASPAWLDHRPAVERSWLWSFPAATAGEVALKDVASQRPTAGLYSATAKPARSTKQPECTLFNVCEDDFQILVRQSGRARWHGVIYICMQAESGIMTSRADYLLVDGPPDVSELKSSSKRRTT